MYRTEHMNLSPKDYAALRPAEKFAYHHCSFYKVWNVEGKGKTTYFRFDTLDKAMKKAAQFDRALIYAGAVRDGDGAEYFCHVAVPRNIKRGSQ